MRKMLRGAGLLFGTFLLLVGGRALILESESLIFHWGSGCFVRRFTGFYCGGCGGTRAFFAMLRGDFARSWSMNPLVLIFATLTLVVMARAALLALFPDSLKWLIRLRVTAKAGWVTLGLLFAFAVARNFACWPFILLAPH